MTTTSTSVAPAPLASTFDSLLTAVSAFKNIRAMALLGLTFLCTLIVGGMLSLLAIKASLFFLYPLATLLGFIVFFYGTNAVGILLMNDAQGKSDVSIIDAVLLSLYTSHRLLAVLILDMLIVLAVVLAIALILLVCKIPVLGPVLFTVIFPASALVLGVLIFALYFVMLPLAGPAVWSGSGVFQTIARINMIIRHKLFNVLISEFILLMITGFVSSIILMIVMTGSGMTSAMSAGIMDLNVGVMMNLSSAMNGSGHMIAAGIGGGLLFAAAGVIPFLIWTKGICLVYLDSARGLDFSKAESKINEQFDGVRRKAEEARNRARDLATKHQDAAPVVTNTPPVAVNPPACPACHATVAPSDVFCGECGHKLT